MAFKYVRWLILLILIIGFSVSNIYAQVTVNGTVRDENGETLPGVTVVEKGTNNGTVTDGEGRYSLEVQGSESVLVFSFVGYTQESVTVGNQSTINMKLVPDVEELGEVVVVGYGTMRKKDLTGSVSSVDAEQIQKVQGVDAVQSLQGQATGVDVRRSSGRAGSGYEFLIRGKSSLTGNTDPLYIVDGVYYDNSINIDPNDIASIDVLKDPSSTAIYGPRGSNGVVIINTKKGKAGETTMSFNSYYGVTEPMGNLPTMNRSQYLKYLRDVQYMEDWYDDPTVNRLNYDPRNMIASRPEAIRGLDSLGTNKDWLDEIYRNGIQQNYNLSIRGGTDKMTYSGSGSYFNEKGLFEGDNFERATVRLNIDGQMTDFMSVGLNSVASYTMHNQRDNPLNGALAMSPLVRARDDNGEIIARPKAPDEDFMNPLITAIDDYHYNRLRETNIFTTVYAQFDFLRNFNFKSSFTADLDYVREGVFQGVYPGLNMTSSVDVYNDHNAAWTWQNILTYENYFNEDHHFKFTGGFEMLEDRMELFEQSAQDLSLNNSQIYNTNSASANLRINSELQRTSRMSGLYRLHYGYKDKYLITTSGRLDAASQLAEGNKSYFFPAVSGAWNVHNENFMSGVNLVSNLKLRAGYGLTGNEAVDPYQTYGLVNQQPLYYEFGVSESPAPGYRSANAPNPSLTWETTAGLNAGVDIGLFENRIQGVVDVFQNNTTKLLQSRSLAPSSGILSQIDNVGEIQTSGIEIQLNSVNINTENFRWSTNITFSTVNEEIKSLSSGRTRDELNEWFVGEPVDVFFDRKMTGVWQISDTTNEAGNRPRDYGANPGDARYLDTNGDTAIDGNDRVVVGKQRPDWTGGITNSFKYKNFDFSFFFYARVGHMVRDGVRQYFFDNAREHPMNWDYWTPQNPTNTMPSPNFIGNRSGNTDISTLGYRDGSFVKLKNVDLGYTLPQNLLDQLGIKSCRVYVSVNNVLAFGDYFTQGSGNFLEGNRWDPEIGDGNGSINSPAPRTYTAGINLDF